MTSCRKLEVHVVPAKAGTQDGSVEEYKKQRTLLTLEFF
jgi:hypothetical protein